MADSVRRTKVRITFAGVDITDAVYHELLSLQYTDNEDGETDDLQMKFADRDGVWLRKWMPTITETVGMKISAEINLWDENGHQMLTTGEFELDEPSHGGPPSACTIRGTSLDYGSSLRKTEKTKAWVGYTLQGIAAEIAGNGGMSLVYESSENPTYERTEQDKESDMDFLEDLCETAGISLKVTDGQIVLFDQATYEAKDPIRTVTWGDGSYLSWDLETGEAETAYTSVRVMYSNPLTKETYDATYVADEESDADSEKANRYTTSAYKVSSNADALALGEKLARLHNKFLKTVTFTVPGDPTAVAGVTWQLEDWGMWSGKYIITRATHTVDSGGYETQVLLRMCQS